MKKFLNKIFDLLKPRSIGRYVPEGYIESPPPNTLKPSEVIITRTVYTPRITNIPNEDFKNLVIGELSCIKSMLNDIIEKRLI
jgi:hypothetical protein